MYKSSARLQRCARAATFIRATKIRIPSPHLHAHSGLPASPVALSRFEAAVMFNTPVFSSSTHPLPFNSLLCPRGRSLVRSCQGAVVLRWSERGDSLGVGAERNPNAWRRLGSRSWTEPCHAGTEGFKVSV